MHTKKPVNPERSNRLQSFIDTVLLSALFAGPYTKRTRSPKRKSTLHQRCNHFGVRWRWQEARAKKRKSRNTPEGTSWVHHLATDSAMVKPAWNHETKLIPVSQDISKALDPGRKLCWRTSPLQVKRIEKYCPWFVLPRAARGSPRFIARQRLKSATWYVLSSMVKVSMRMPVFVRCRISLEAAVVDHWQFVLSSLQFTASPRKPKDSDISHVAHIHARLQDQLRDAMRTQHSQLADAQSLPTSFVGVWGRA